MSSGGIDEDEFCVLLSHDGEFGLVDGSDAVTDRNPLPIDENSALGGGKVGMPMRRRVGECGSGKKRSAQDTRIGADQQGIGILRLSACQLDEASGAIRFGKFAAVPARRPAALARKQPDLEKLKGVFVAIVFGMTDSSARTDDLDVASPGAVLLPPAVLD